MLIPTGEEVLQIAGKRAQVRSSILARGDRKNKMTTNNIDGIDSAEDILGELGRLAKKAENRAEALVRERQGIETRRRNAIRGMRVVERRLRDREQTLGEEAIQLDWILRGDDEGPVPTPEPPAPPVAAPDPLDDTPRTPRGPVEPPTTPTPVVQVIDPRNWTVWQWLFAFVGAIIGLLVAAATDQLIFDGNGFGQFLWVIALVGTGFFGGGAIGSTIDD